MLEYTITKQVSGNLCHIGLNLMPAMHESNTGNLAYFGILMNFAVPFGTC